MSAEHHEDPEGVVIAHHEAPEVDELGPDEPQTPGWMPLLGGVLFISASIFFVATQPPGKTADELKQAAQAAAQEAAAKAAPPPAPEPAPAAVPAAPGGEPPKRGG